MKKTVVIGASALDIQIRDNIPVSLVPHGRMLHVAARLAKDSIPVSFVSEAARDRVGDLIVDRLASLGVGVGSVDRFAGGHTPLNLRFEADATHPETDSVRYRAYPEGMFDAVWPRLDPDDIAVMGDYFAVAPRSFRFIREFVGSLRQRRVMVVYAPGFEVHQGKRLTAVKPSLLDNLEWANFIIATRHEVETLFGAATLADAYRDSISFYCPNFIGIETDAEGPALTFFGKRHALREPLADSSLVETSEGQAAVIAAIVKGIAGAGITCAEIAEGLTDERRLAMLSEAGLDNLPLNR